MITFNYEKALSHLKYGKAIKVVEWPENTFIIYSEDGTYRDENGDLFDFSSQWDEDNFVLIEEDECPNQTPATSTKKDSCTTPELSEQERGLSDQRNDLENDQEILESSSKNERDPSSDITPIPNIKSEFSDKDEKHTIATKENETLIENNIGETIGINKKNITKNITTKTNEQSSLESSSSDEKGIQQSSSDLLSECLNEERSNSMKSLNDSVSQLMTLAKGVCPSEMRNVHPTSAKLATACFSEIRNTLKVKLDYLKFAKELGDIK